MKKLLGILSGLAALVFVMAHPASADQILYYTNFGGSSTATGSIQKLDLTMGTNTAVVSGLVTPDSMLFSNPTTIVFTQANTGTVNQVTTNGTGETTLTSGLNFPEDLALDPGGQSVLVSDTNGKSVVRINLLTNTVTTLASFSAPVRGITYDSSGRLFVNVDASGNPTIVQLDPVTGTVLKSLSLPSGGDGLTFDPNSGALWTVALNNSAILRITDLSSSTEFVCPNLSNVNLCGNYDGIEADGNGNVDIANNIGYVDQYNIASGTFSALAPAPNIDDLAPVVGLGSPGPGATPTPEPSSALLVAIGALAMFLFGKSRSARHQKIS